MMPLALSSVCCLLLAPAAPQTPATAEIRCHAIVEAPVGGVWAAVAERREVGRWLFQRAEAWSPAAGRPFSVTAHGLGRVTGTFLDVEPEKHIQLSWPEPAATFTVELRAIDDYLTMVTLLQAGRDEAGPEDEHAREDARQRWVLAMTKLHRLFPPPVVDTARHRPDVPGLFVERSLIVNGDFEHSAPGRYDGVAFGWETNTARPSPQVHAVDDKVAHGGRRSQRIAHPPDWTHFAVQQFTSHLEPLITPGRRYRLTAWVKAEGIRNPAGWYKLGLWCTDAAGRPIGEPLKNEKRTDAEGRVVLNHDWERIVIEGVAPAGAARAVVIFSGHWDDAGSVWYDDVRLWELEPPATTASRRQARR